MLWAPKVECPLVLLYSVKTHTRLMNSTAGKSLNVLAWTGPLKHKQGDIYIFHGWNAAQTRYLELCHELLQVDDELLHPGIISFIIIKLLLWRHQLLLQHALWPLVYSGSLLWDCYLLDVVRDGQEAADPRFHLRLYGCCVQLGQALLWKKDLIRVWSFYHKEAL